jgi:hypothetical protein
MKTMIGAALVLMSSVATGGTGPANSTNQYLRDSADYYDSVPDFSLSPATRRSASTARRPTATTSSLSSCSDPHRRHHWSPTLPAPWASPPPGLAPIDQAFQVGPASLRPLRSLRIAKPEPWSAST